jgi:hypothetical protein
MATLPLSPLFVWPVSNSKFPDEVWAGDVIIDTSPPLPSVDGPDRISTAPPPPRPRPPSTNRLPPCSPLPAAMEALPAHPASLSLSESPARSVTAAPHCAFEFPPSILSPPPSDVFPEPPLIDTPPPAPDSELEWPATNDRWPPAQVDEFPADT